MLCPIILDYIAYFSFTFYLLANSRFYEWVYRFFYELMRSSFDIKISYVTLLLILHILQHTCTKGINDILPTIYPWTTKHSLLWWCTKIASRMILRIALWHWSHEWRTISCPLYVVLFVKGITIIWSSLSLILNADYVV